MYAAGPGGALHRFFAGLAENVFEGQLGVADPPLVDYISDLLCRFIRVDTVYRVRNLSGRPVREVGEMLLEAEERIGQARREVHRHIGDFTLFWTGMYPESLRELRSPTRLDHFIDYCTQGKRAYMIAATINVDEEESAPSDVLQRLSTQFEMCAYGLREVRREWEEGDDNEDRPRPLLVT